MTSDRYAETASLAAWLRADWLGRGWPDAGDLWFWLVAEYELWGGQWPSN